MRRSLQVRPSEASSELDFDPPPMKGGGKGRGKAPKRAPARAGGAAGGLEQEKVRACMCFM